MERVTTTEGFTEATGISAPVAAPPTLSVIIPTFNRADRLREQLSALAAERYPRWWEVVVADNRSTDHTAQVVAEFADRLPVRLVEAHERQCRAYAVNAGAATARGEALIWLDNDDVVEPGYLSAMGEALARTPFVGARIDTTGLNAPWLRERRAGLQSGELPRLAAEYPPFVVGAAFGVRRSVFEQLGGCDESLEALEDLDLSWRLHYAGYRAAFVPGAVLQYRYRESLAETFRQERSYGRWEVALLVKHRSLGGLPPRPLRRTIAGWLQVLLAVRGLRTPGGRARFVTAAGAALGRVEGSLRHQVLYL